MAIISHYREYWKDNCLKQRTRIIEPIAMCDFPIGFFDEASQDRAGGCGFILYLDKDHIFRGWMGIDQSTNNLSKLLAV